MNETVILGIDPGIAITGYGIISMGPEGPKPVAYGCVNTSKDMEGPLRLLEIHKGLSEVIRRYSPVQASVEKLFFSKNVSTAMRVSEARGVAILACAQAGVKVFEYTPPQVKASITGSGSAVKSQVQQMLMIVLGLPCIPRPDDAADALAMAYCHANSSGLLTCIEKGVPR